MTDTTLADISIFLTKDVIDKAFKVRTRSEDTVNNVEVSRAAAAGEGLLSAVYRIKVTGHKHTTSFVVKVLVADPLLNRTLNCKKYFKREIEFFTQVLPVISDLQIKLGAKERIFDHIPICYSVHHDGVNDYILLEDLLESNCHSVNETPSGVEKNVVLETLAHFHAVSIALRINNPEKFTEIADSLPEMYYNEENRDWYSTYLRNAIDADYKVIAEMEGTDSIYYKKFTELLSKDMYGQYINSVNNRGENPVICHGDCWAPNFMISDKRMVIIDFQIIRCASLATDLSYWIMLCINHKSTKLDFLNAVDIYYSALAYYLRDLGLDASKVFSREVLDEELRLYGGFGYLASLTSFALMAADKCDYSSSIEEQFPGYEKVPLERLWIINPIEDEKQKLRLQNAIRVAVDVGII